MRRWRGWASAAARCPLAELCSQLCSAQATSLFPSALQPQAAYWAFVPTGFLWVIGRNTPEWK